MTTILGDERVLLKVHSAAPAGSAAEQSLILSKGQRQGDIEVMEIDLKQERARIRVLGNELPLTLQKEGPAASAPPLPAPPLPR